MSRPPSRQVQTIVDPKLLPVLELISFGRTDKEIGATLFISAHTSKMWAALLRAQLGAEDRAHTVMLGFERGLLRSSGPEPADIRLTEREQQILELFAAGRSRTQIARQLQRCEATVMLAIKDLYRVLGTRNRAHAVRLGIEHGLLEPGGDRG